MTALVRAERERESRINDRRLALKERKRREKREAAELERAKANAVKRKKRRKKRGSESRAPKATRDGLRGANPYVLGGDIPGFLPPARPAVRLRDAAHGHDERKPHVDDDDDAEMRERAYEQAFLPAIVTRERDAQRDTKRRLAERAKKKKLAGSKSTGAFPRLAHEESALTREIHEACGLR